MKVGAAAPRDTTTAPPKLLPGKNTLTLSEDFNKNNCWAGIAQLVEYKLPKLGVAGSNPVARSSPGVDTVLVGTELGRRATRFPHRGGRLWARGEKAGLL